MIKRGLTIERHIMETQREHPEATGEFSILLSQIILAGKIISSEVNRAGLADILGLSGHENVQGEEVQKLDDFANQTIVNVCQQSGQLCVMVSEEEKVPIEIPEEYLGRYVLVFDPLDGSSNIDVNINIGTIFSIYRKVNDTPKGNMIDILQKGLKQVCAGYIIYGSSTMFVYTTGHGVHGFTLDPAVGEFFLSHENIQIPQEGKTYSANEGNYKHWTPEMQKYIDHLKGVGPDDGDPYSYRYVGSLVADFHRTLLKGGIFMYPADNKDPNKPHGKLRLLYEASPMSFIAEQAGGYGSDGEGSILAIQPTELHQRVPLFIGSAWEVKKAEAFLQGREFEEAPTEEDTSSEESTGEEETPIE